MTDTDHRPQLKAAEVSTEVQLDEDRVPGPAYVDLTSAESQRKRIIPKHWATREAAGRHVRLAAERNAHRAAYHGVRSPGYAALAAGYAVRGLFVTAIRIIEWRPDAKSLPTGVSANVSQRFCLKVMGQLENDMILGTSAYKQGIRATTFRAGVDAGLGYQVGAAAHPLVVRTYYLDMAATEKIAARSRALREAAGTLSGVALGEDDTAPQRDVLADVLEVFGDAAGLHWGELATRLARRFPERWEGTSGDAVSAECRAKGVPSVVVTVAGERGRGCRLDAVQAAAGQR